MFHKDPLAARQLFELIDSDLTLEGAGVVYIGDGACHVVRPSTHLTGFATWIVLEETPYVPMPNGRPALPTKDIRTSGRVKDLVGAGFKSCLSTAVTGVVALGAATAAPVTGGTSGILVLVAGAAALSSAAQCGLSIGRVINELVDPGLNESHLDNADWYKWSDDILEAVGLAGIVVGAPSLYSGLSKVLQMRRITGKGVGEILKGLSRVERKRVAKELAMASRQLSGRKWKELVRAGKLPNIYSSTQINAAIREQLLNSVATVLDLHQSGTNGHIALLVHLVQEQ